MCMAFPRGFQTRLHITGREVLLVLHVRLQRILPKVREGSVPRLTIPSLRTPGLSVPGLVAPSWVGPGLAAPSWIGPGLVVPSLFAPSWVGPGLAAPSVGPCLAAPHWKASGCVQIALKIAGIEAGIVHKYRTLLEEMINSMSEKGNLKS